MYDLANTRFAWKLVGKSCVINITTKLNVKSMYKCVYI